MFNLFRGPDEWDFSLKVYILGLNCLNMSCQKENELVCDLSMLFAVIYLVCFSSHSRKHKTEYAHLWFALTPIFFYSAFQARVSAGWSQLPSHHTHKTCISGSFPVIWIMFSLLLNLTSNGSLKRFKQMPDLYEL